MRFSSRTLVLYRELQARSAGDQSDPESRDANTRGDLAACGARPFDRSPVDGRRPTGHHNPKHQRHSHRDPDENETGRIHAARARVYGLVRESGERVASGRCSNRVVRETGELRASGSSAGSIGRRGGQINQRDM